MVIVAFVAGLIVGIAGDHVYLFHVHRLFPGHRMADFAAHRIADRLDSELHLTPQQKTLVQQIIDHHRARIDAMMRGVHPQIRQELDATNAEIEKILTPDQRAQFAKIRMRMPRRPPGMGPPPPR